MQQDVETNTTNYTINFIRKIWFFCGSILIIDCSLLIAFSNIHFGTIVPFVIGIVFLVHAIFWQTIKKILDGSHMLKVIWQLAWFGFLAWFISFCVFIGILIKHIQSENSAQTVDIIIVLGAGIKNGKPSKTLASRLDKAGDYWQRNRQATIMTTGGVGFGKKFSEASVMADYLIHKHHIPPQHILKEETSTSTQENIAFGKKILIDTGVDIQTTSLMIVTNDFHTIRAKAIAHKQGYHIVNTLACPTFLSIRANSWFREYFSFVSGWLFGEY